MKYNRKTTPRRLKCKNCGIFKNNRTSLQDHIKLKCDTESTVVLCIDCDQDFRSERSYKRHYKRHYTNQKVFFNECVTLQKQNSSVLLSYTSKHGIQGPFYSGSSAQTHFIPGDYELDENHILMLPMPSTSDNIINVFDSNGTKGSMYEVISMFQKKLLSPNVLFAVINLYVENCNTTEAKKCIMIPVKHFMQKGETVTAMYNPSFVLESELQKRYNCIIVPIFVNVFTMLHFFLIIFDISKNECLICHSESDIITEQEVGSIKEKVKSLLNLADFEFTTIMMNYSQQWDRISSGLFVFQYVKDYMTNTKTVVKQVHLDPIRHLMFKILAENGLLATVWKQIQDHIHL